MAPCHRSQNDVESRESQTTPNSDGPLSVGVEKDAGRLNVGSGGLVSLNKVLCESDSDREGLIDPSHIAL